MTEPNAQPAPDTTPAVADVPIAVDPATAGQTGQTPPQKASLGRTVLVTVNLAQNNGSDVAPATIVRAWSDELVNLKVHTDGATDLWLTSIPLHADRQALDEAAAKWRDSMLAGGYQAGNVPNYSGAFWPPREG
jgi:hypothetical protein